MARAERTARIAELVAINYTTAQINEALHEIRRTLQRSGLAGAARACLRLEKIRRSLEATILPLDRQITAAVRRHEASRS